MSQIKEQIIKILHGSEYVSGEDLSRTLGISRTAIWKHIQSLKELGYDVDSQARKGYRIINLPDLLHPPLIREQLTTRFIGCKIDYHESLPSTNNRAKEIAEKGVPEGTIVIAEKQLQGKGRLGRAWESPPGGIWTSVILRPQLPPTEIQIITLVAACAVAQTLRENNIPAQIKWPNDILLEGKKVCGILTELKAEMDGVNFVVLGIGINVNSDRKNYPQALKDIVSSLKIFTGRHFNRVSLLCLLLKNLEKMYDEFLQNGPREILKIWKKYNLTLNNYVRIKSSTEEFSGLAIDLDEKGGLIVKDDKGERRIVYSGEVTLKK